MASSKHSTRTKAAAKSTKLPNPHPSEFDGEVLYEQVRNQPAWFNQKKMFELEARFTCNGFGQTRRALLAVLSVTGKKLFDDINKDREYAVALAEIADRADGYISHLEAAVDIMRSAQARLLLGLAGREDMTAVREEAKAAAAQVQS